MGGQNEFENRPYDKSGASEEQAKKEGIKEGKKELESFLTLHCCSEMTIKVRTKCGFAHLVRKICQDTQFTSKTTSSWVTTGVIWALT